MPLISKEDLIKARWKVAIEQKSGLAWLLRPSQKILDQVVKAKKAKLDNLTVHIAGQQRVSKRLVINAGRRWGKSSYGFLWLYEQALLNPKTHYLFLAPVKDKLESYLTKVVDKLFIHCPQIYSPKWEKGMYTLPNGSTIEAFGTTNESWIAIKGQAFQAAFIDECGEMDSLETVINSIVSPTLFDSQGIMLIASAPGETPDHYFKTLCEEAQLYGYYQHFTIHEAGYPPEFIEQELFEVAKGDVTNSTWRRQYLAEFVRDDNSTIVKSWKPIYTTNIPARDQYFGYYYKGIALDIGTKHDLTAVLFFYYDFLNAKLIFLDEIMIEPKDFSSRILAEKIRQKQKEVFGEYPVQIHISDHSDILNDLNKHENLPFTTVGKEELHSMVNRFDVLTAGGQVLVDPKCKLLIATLQNAMWDTNREKFAHSASGLGHMDMLACAIYASRGIEYFFHTNPIPNTHNYQPANQLILNNPDASLSREGKELAKLWEQPAIESDERSMDYPFLEDPSERFDMFDSNGRFKEWPQ